MTNLYESRNFILRFSLFSHFRATSNFIFFYLRSSVPTYSNSKIGNKIYALDSTVSFNLLRLSFKAKFKRVSDDKGHFVVKMFFEGIWQVAQTWCGNSFENKYIFIVLTKRLLNYEQLLNLKDLHIYAEIRLAVCYLT